MKRTVLIASTLLLLAPAAAQAAEEAMRVQVGDLNLASPAGANTALRRIRQAADTWCGGKDDLSLRVYVAARACRAEMTAKAVAALDAPLVVALHAGRRADVELARR